MAFVVEPDKVICFRCGKAYKQRRGFFLVSYAACHKGIGFLPYCKDCIDVMYAEYLSRCHNARDAARQMCRKLDLYWNESVFNSIEKKTVARTVMAQYIQKINGQAYAGKCYDDTLEKEGTLWSFDPEIVDETLQKTLEQAVEQPETDQEQQEEIEIPEELMKFWGSGYAPEVYHELEERRTYWMSSFQEGECPDIATEALIRQICALELDINRARASGKDVGQLVANLDKLIGSLGMKPTQKKQDDADASMANTPMGVWLYRYENLRPLPEVDDDLKDVNGIRRYVFTWMGHLCKMLGLKNAYSQLYEDEIARLRVERPEYDGDDEAFMTDLMLDNEQDTDRHE